MHIFNFFCHIFDFLAYFRFFCACLHEYFVNFSSYSFSSLYMIFRAEIVFNRSRSHGRSTEYVAIRCRRRSYTNKSLPHYRK